MTLQGHLLKLSTFGLIGSKKTGCDNRFSLESTGSDGLNVFMSYNVRHLVGFLIGSFETNTEAIVYGSEKFGCCTQKLISVTLEVFQDTWAHVLVLTFTFVCTSNHDRTLQLISRASSR